jgi:hypothetical protein
MRPWGTSLRRRYWLYSAGLAVPMAQVGHLLSYALHYGGAAGAIQSSGTHAYFPELLKASLGVLAAGLLAALLLIGAARILLGERLGNERRPGLPFADLALACLCFQLDVYVVQEVAEAVVGGQALSGQLLATVCAWGLVGQGPLALLAALALHWLSIRLQPVLAELRYALERPALDVPFLSIGVQTHAPPGPGRVRYVSRAASPTRGPPVSR